MEIKATLNKPYTDSERIDFIIEQNHRKGYEIKETYDALEAWGLTAEEQEKQEKQAQIKQLTAQCDSWDLKAIRPMRAKEAGTATQEDLDKLAEIEEIVSDLREQIRNLQGE